MSGEWPEQCRCGHGPELHDLEGDPALCMVCGDNTHCNYADDEEIAADRWDEGYHAAVIHLRPHGLSEGERLLWSLGHMPQDNPYRTGVVEIDVTDCPDCGLKGRYEGRVRIHGRGYYQCPGGHQWQDAHEKPSNKGTTPVWTEPTP